MIVPIVCWGPHIELAKQCIKSLGDAEYKIYTNEGKRFDGYETRTPPEFGRTKHQTTTKAYIESLKEGPVCTISPDMIASEGLLKELERHLDKKLVMVPVVRVNANTTVKIFNDWPVVKSRDLARIAMEYQHDLQRLQFLDKIPAFSNPTNVFQRKGNTLAVRCFHMHPILLNCKPEEVSAPIDDFMVTRFKKEDIYIVQDSDEMMVVDQTPLDYNWNGTRLTEPVDTKEFIYRKCNPMHRWFFEHECYIHSGEIEKHDPDARMDAILKLSRETPQR